MTRLETLSPDLVAALRRSSTAKQRAVGLAASEFAIARAKVAHPLVEGALKRARAAGALTANEQAQLGTLAAKLDEEYFALQDAAEEGRASAEDYLRLFGQARAVSALAFAGSNDAFEAATEAIYEAAATTNDKQALIDLVQSVLQ